MGAVVGVAAARTLVEVTVRGAPFDALEVDADPLVVLVEDVAVLPSLDRRWLAVP